ncbi:hypothetical protein [Kordiimonas pumila]|uniref:Cobalamin biosynthesis protein CobD n=1 Tax=Kordiimonas pumila TaxID=2161677 RepID=A0ABV7CZH3_9PROT|nr:hypothetical protein [Kordiimonas pumila]
MRGQHINILSDIFYLFINSGPALIHWLGLIGAALVTDLVIGGWIARIIPSIDRPFQTITDFLTQRLNRSGRSYAALRMRGAILVLAFTPLLWIAGKALNFLSETYPVAAVLCFIILLPLVGQKPIWLLISSPTEQAATQIKTDAHTVPQRRAQKVTFHFAGTYLANITLVLLGGFAFLLPFRFLASWLSPKDALVHEKTGAFYKPPLFLHSIMAFPGVFIACALLFLSRFFYPGTKLYPIISTAPKPKQIPGSTYWPLALMASGLGLNFKQTLLHPQKTIWIGPPNGTAKLTVTHLKKVWYLIVIATGFSYILFLMLYVYLING